MVAIFPFLFPLYLIRGETFGIPVTLPEVVLAFMALYCVIREEFWHDSWLLKHKKDILIWPVILFVLTALIGATVAPNVSYFADGTEFLGRIKALGILKGWIFMPVAYFFMARYYFKEKPSLVALSLRALTLGGVVLSLCALYQVWTGNYMTVDMRASGPFESANYLALYLGPLVVFSVLAFLNTKSNWDRVLLAVSCVLCSLALYFTDSFASWIAVLVTLFVAFGFYLRKKSLGVRVTVFLGIVLVGAALFVSQIGTEKFAQFLEFSDRSSSSVRLQVYDVAWNLIKQNPIFGVGLGQFEQAYSANAVAILGKEPFELVMIHPHNIFFALWLNMGLLGLFSFLWLLWVCLAWLFENDKKERRIAAFMLLAIVIHGFFDTPIFKNDLAFEFWLLLAMLI